MWQFEKNVFGFKEKKAVSKLVLILNNFIIFLYLLFHKYYRFFGTCSLWLGKLRLIPSKVKLEGGLVYIHGRGFVKFVMYCVFFSCIYNTLSLRTESCTWLLSGSRVVSQIVNLHLFLICLQLIQPVVRSPSRRCRRTRRHSLSGLQSLAVALPWKCRDSLSRKHSHWSFR